MFKNDTSKISYAKYFTIRYRTTKNDVQITNEHDLRLQKASLILIYTHL